MTTLKTGDMRVWFHKLCCMVLVLSGSVFCSHSDSGCESWTVSAEDVCCTKCKPGNRLVKHCGEDPALLCRPCDPQSFTTDPQSLFCSRCTQCVGAQITVKHCNSTSDTVCGCRSGLRCGNEICDYCVTECREGQEPTEFRSCRKCPEGTFNDKIHSPCRKWKESCPGEQITEPTGNAFRDHECKSANEIRKTRQNKLDVKIHQTTEANESEMDNFLPVVTKENNDEVKWLPVAIAGGVALLAVLCIIASVFTCIQTQTHTEKPQVNSSTPAHHEASEESRMMVEQEACSFHQPEQEHGSSQSISTQDSEVKLIV